MFLIKELTSEPRQRHTLILPDGSTTTVTLEYKPMQSGWFILKLTHKDFELNNIRVVTNPNMLHQFKNQIPFGLACFTEGNFDPTDIEDLSSGRSKIYILSVDEVREYEDVLSGQAET